MPTRKKSARSSKLSNAPTDRPRRSHVARDIISGLKEAVAFTRGEISLPVRMVNVREPVDVRALRAKLGLSQSEFASQYGISLRTLQEWEQGRTSPDSTVRAYLTVIERNPQAVVDALSAPARR
jgi:putative transcriptional regulator